MDEVWRRLLVVKWAGVADGSTSRQMGWVMPRSSSVRQDQMDGWQ